MLAAAPDRRQPSRRALVESRLALQDLRIAEYRVEGGAQLVAHRREESALGAIRDFGGVFRALRFGEYRLQVSDRLGQTLRHRVDARGEHADLVVRLERRARRQVAGRDLLGYSGEAVHRPDDVAAEQEYHRHRECDCEQPAGAGLQLRRREALAGARKAALQLALLLCRHLGEQLQQCLGLRRYLGAVQVEVFVGVLAVEDGDDPQRELGDRSALLGDHGQARPLLGGQLRVLARQRVPYRSVGRELWAVAELEVELARRAVGHQVGGHRVEGGLEAEQVGEQLAIAGRVLTLFLQLDHRVDAVHDLHPQSLHLDPCEPQRRPVLQRVVVQLEQLLRQLEPARVGLVQLGQRARRVALGPVGRHRLQRREALLERAPRGLVLLDVGRVAQHQIAAHMQLHPQQAGLGLCRRERRRPAHALGQHDVVGRASAGHERERRDHHRHPCQRTERQRELGADAQRLPVQVQRFRHGAHLRVRATPCRRGAGARDRGGW